MKIIYCHHAHRKIELVSTQNDDITSLGEQDAKLVAQLLEAIEERNKTKIKAIYTSQFLRCTKTANLINSLVNAPIIVDKRLDEYTSINRETWLDCQNRTYESLVDIIKNNNNDDIIVCVSSGKNIAIFMALAFKLKPYENMPIIGVTSCSPIMINIDKEEFIERLKVN